jgi:hypothetical protein
VGTTAAGGQTANAITTKRSLECVHHCSEPSVSSQDCFFFSFSACSGSRFALKAYILEVNPESGHFRRGSTSGEENRDFREFLVLPDFIPLQNSRFNRSHPIQPDPTNSGVS